MKIFFWICMLFLFDHRVYSQIDIGYIGYPQLIIKPGYTFQSHNVVNFECAIGEQYGSMHGLIYKGTGGGIRLIFDKNKIYSIYAFKECGVFFLTSRINVFMNYVRDNIDLRLIPEIGLTNLGTADMTVGYNLSLLTKKHKEISSFNFNLRIATTVQYLGKEKN